MRLIKECVLEEEWMTEICIAFLGGEIIGYFDLPSNRTWYMSSSFIFSFWMDLLSFSLKTLCVLYACQFSNVYIVCLPKLTDC